MQDTRWRGGVLPICREAVGVFYSPSRLGKVFCLYVYLSLGACVLFNVSMFVYVLLLTRIFAYILACIFTHIHLFLSSGVEKIG